MDTRSLDLIFIILTIFGMKKKTKEETEMPKTVLIVYAHPEANSWTGIIKDSVVETLYDDHLYE